MPRIAPLSGAFNAGEISPRLAARTDFQKYPNGLEEVLNLVPLAEGGLMRRPGTRFVAEVENSSVKGRLMRFEFSTEDTHILEFGNLKLRFYRSQGQIESGGAPLEIATPWTEAQLPDLRAVQSASVLYLFHPDVSPRKLERASLTSWTLSEVEWQDGPWGGINPDADLVQKQLAPNPDLRTGMQDWTRAGSATGAFVDYDGAGQRITLRTQTTGNAATAETEVPTGSRQGTSTLYIAHFRVVGGGRAAADDATTLRVGSTSGGVDIVAEAEFIPGWHTISYTTASNTNHFYRFSFTQDDSTGGVSDLFVYPEDANLLEPSGTSGSITVTAHGFTPFASTDVGRSIRLEYPGRTAGWGVITGYTSSTVVTVSVKRNLPVAEPTEGWRLGAWSETTGWPRVGAFFEQRLFVAGTSDQTQTLWASQTGDFENFRPDSEAGAVEDDDGLDFTLSADDVNAIRWMSAGEDTLVIGTTGGEWVPSSDGPVLTPNDLTIRRQTTQGSASVPPVRVGNIVLFVQRAQRKVREFGFSFESDGFVAPDMTRLAEHITSSGIAEMAYAQEPDSIVWAVREDGVLLSMTFRRDEDVVGWARHITGGAFGSGNAVVESVATIPGRDGSGQVQSSRDRDEVWLIVKRTINGATKRYVEVMERPFETDHDQEDAYYADSLITYDGAATTTISGLDHLEGQVVKVWGDGAVLPEATVSSGAITLDEEVSVAQIGLGYTHRAKTLKVEGGNPAGTAVGRKKRIYGVTFVVLNSHGMRFGPDTGNLDGKDFRVVSDAMDAGAPLFTGEEFVEFDGDWGRDTRIVVESSDPAPFTLLAMVPEIDVRPQV